MRKTLFTLLFMTFALLAFAQMPKKAAQNRNLGFLMYKSERASWVGSDLLYAKYPHLYKQAGGYVSYTKNDTSTCVFYSLNNPDVPVIRFHFDPTLKASRVRVDTTILDLTENEKTLIAMRIKADKDVRTDTLYEHYKNTNYNIVPIAVRRNFPKHGLLI